MKAPAAAEICRRLAIPHHVIDLVQDYEQNVLEDFSRQSMVVLRPTMRVVHRLETRRPVNPFDKFATGITRGWNGMR